MLPLKHRDRVLTSFAQWFAGREHVVVFRTYKEIVVYSTLLYQAFSVPDLLRDLPAGDPSFHARAVEQWELEKRGLIHALTALGLSGWR